MCTHCTQDFKVMQINFLNYLGILRTLVPIIAAVYTRTACRPLSIHPIFPGTFPLFYSADFSLTSLIVQFVHMVSRFNVYYWWFHVCVGGNQSGICLLMLATMCIGRMNSSILHLFSGSDVENREVVFMKHK